MGERLLSCLIVWVSFNMSLTWRARERRNRWREQDFKNIWIWLCLLCDRLPTSHLFFHSGECSSHCMCVGLEWSSSNLARPQHAMNMYRRQMNFPISWSLIYPAKYGSSALYPSVSCMHTQTYSSCLCSSYFQFTNIAVRVLGADVSCSLDLPSLITYSIFSSFPQLCYTFSAIIWHFVFLCISLSFSVLSVHSHRSSNHH